MIACLQALAPGGSTELNAAALEAIAEEAPSAKLPRDQVVASLLAEIMATVKLQGSKSAARRMIQVSVASMFQLTSCLIFWQTSSDGDPKSDPDPFVTLPSHLSKLTSWFMVNSWRLWSHYCKNTEEIPASPESWSHELLVARLQVAICNKLAITQMLLFHHKNQFLSIVSLQLCGVSAGYDEVLLRFYAKLPFCHSGMKLCSMCPDHPLNDVVAL